MSEKKLDDVLGSSFHKQEGHSMELIYKKLRGNLFIQEYCVPTMASHVLKYSKNDIHLYILN